MHLTRSCLPNPIEEQETSLLARLAASMAETLLRATAHQGSLATVANTQRPPPVVRNQTRSLEHQSQVPEHVPIRLGRSIVHLNTFMSSSSGPSGEGGEKGVSKLDDVFL